jgi:4-hydroxy-tetrahydrodipicolinate synthase
VFEELRAEEGNGTNVSVVKAALQLLGNDCGHVRPPGAWPLTERQMGKLQAALSGWGLLGASRAAA